MKYKNIELIESKDSEAELLCNVEFENSDCEDEIVENFEDSLIELFEGFEPKIEIETVTDDSIQVRCGSISFDKKGVAILKKIYDKYIPAKACEIIIR